MIRRSDCRNGRRRRVRVDPTGRVRSSNLGERGQWRSGWKDDEIVVAIDARMLTKGSDGSRPFEQVLRLKLQRMLVGLEERAQPEPGSRSIRHFDVRSQD